MILLVVAFIVLMACNIILLIIEELYPSPLSKEQVIAMAEEQVENDWRQLKGEGV
jgi:hypothetical protein